ncbi:ribokinase [Limnochorda pilosa]|uniref:Deoxyribokinase n=2 Tax=Limnochorda pilosa TaxID=1555112 RepID=A0A0K2SKY3_LIMPI|nr:ribokinase [Limnochorda pilosa]
MDLTVGVEHLPAPGATVLGHGFRTTPGGKGANQAVAAALAGAPTRILGCLGQDAYGQALRRALSDRDVRTEALLEDPSTPTGVALITVEASGQNTIVVAPGANARLAPRDVEAARPWFDQAGIVVLQQEIPVETVEKAVAQAAALRLPVLLNPAPARPFPLPRSLLEQVAYLVPNETEAAAMAGLPSLEGEEAVREAGRRLEGQGAPTVVITLGARGAFARTGGQELWVPAFSVQAVDATAAGDAFVGGLAAELVRGTELAMALRFASACGALAATRPGAQESLPDRQQVLRFLSEQGVAGP